MANRQDKERTLVDELRQFAAAHVDILGFQKAVKTIRDAADMLVELRRRVTFLERQDETIRRVLGEIAGGHTKPAAHAASTLASLNSEADE